ncbi:MAG: putative metal-dependent transcriptional regulator SloR [Parcubacteria group bacterium Gr01-1014_13]|nr:MAG: putative metal-dependent transcriptional regulator SloR [Parcubacteria group bacterium Gr01-1014_13]
MSRITPTREDYLRAIYRFSQKDTRVRIIDIARNLNLARSTVSERVQDLKNANFIKSGQNEEGIVLSKKGLLLARQLTYKHRLIEVFLHKVLHMDAKKVHAEAHKLEHAFSDEVIARLAKFLGNPKKDPHGEKITKV